MTQLLEEVIAKIRDLPAEEQNSLAAILLEELRDEAHWDQSFAESQAKLGELAQKVGSDVRAGRVRKGRL